MGQDNRLRAAVAGEILLSCLLLKPKLSFRNEGENCAGDGGARFGSCCLKSDIFCFVDRIARKPW